MENLEKQMRDLFSHFAKQELGNRLSDFAFGALQQIVIKMIRDYKVANKTEEKKKE